jgi:hypothetical protein
MPKRNDASPTPAIEERLLKWLSDEGYPFELRVGRILRDAGWDVDHAQVFVDTDTGKRRNIDLVASVHANRRTTHSLVTVCLVIECKATTEKPWVVFTSEPASPIPGGAVSLVPTTLGTGVMIHAMELEGKCPTFTVPSKIGHGVIRAFSEGGSADPTGAYSALTGAVAAAAALMTSHVRLWLQHGGSEFRVLKVCLPVVVLDGRLFEMSLDEIGKEHLAEVNTSIAWARDPTDPASSVLVRIVTAAELPTFATQSLVDAKELATNAVADAPAIWSKLRSMPAALKLLTRF